MIAHSMLNALKVAVKAMSLSPLIEELMCMEVIEEADAGRVSGRPNMLGLAEARPSTSGLLPSSVDYAVAAGGSVMDSMPAKPAKAPKWVLWLAGPMRRCSTWVGRSHAYNKGRTFVVSKLPLPNYRVDLDDRHGSTRKEINMSTETARRVDSLLGSSSKAPQNDESHTVSMQRSMQSSTFAATKSNSTAAGDIPREMANNDLREKLQLLKAAPAYRAMQSFREKLPAYNVRTEFLDAVAANQILVVSGETGCGKTTQLPQFILEAEIDSLRGMSCNIICTQPRRISAMSVAARISNERAVGVSAPLEFFCAAAVAAAVSAPPPPPDLRRRQICAVALLQPSPDLCRRRQICRHRRQICTVTAPPFLARQRRRDSTAAFFTPSAALSSCCCPAVLLS
ncbi:DExH-box ATP-dependent RNA helicase [Nymphaea thermarum]|nr:DExH-box ATP-dependent RNA helicase [Nymphaea thermarum]